MTETSWRPVGTTPRRGSTAFHAGLQTVAAMFSQNSPETKQNSPVNACMCSTNNKKKKSKYCLFASCESEKNKFEIIEQLFKQPFASKEFTWTALNAFEEGKFD